MKTKMLMLIIIALNTCTQSQGEVKPSFILRNDEATMPVVVRGNIASHTLVVFLHGGPGGTALKKIGTRTFSKLEEYYGVVYWDQRGGDGASGGTNKKWMNLNQYIEDLDLLVDQLTYRYSASSIFLMGHCWGGGLGIAYLMNTQRQAKIAGWIDVAGAHNNPKGDSLSAEGVKKFAAKMIAGNKNACYWKRALLWYQCNPAFTSDQLMHYTYVRKSNGYQLVEGDSLGLFPCYTKKDLLLHPVRYIRYYANYYNTLTRFVISGINLTSEMHRITLPALIIWGEEDGLIPVAMAKEAYEVLGTNKEDKYLVTFENTAHTVYYEQPVKFVQSVKTFVDQYTRHSNESIARKTVSI